MDPGILVLVSLGTVLFGLASARLRRTPVTGPLVFTLLGLVAGESVLGLMPIDAGSATLHTVAELALGLILFSDATHVSLSALKRRRSIETRLLVFALPGSILVGGLLAKAILPELGNWDALLLATLVTPTDAVLGRAFLLDRRVPERIRLPLNVESGLNDGLCLPILFVILCLARVDAHPSMTSEWTMFTIRQVLVGPMVGALVGLAGGAAITRAHERGWMAPDHHRLSLVALATLAYGLALATGGNGFLATFCAGLSARRFARDRSVAGFLESESLALSLLSFFIFGLVLLPRSLPHMLGPAALFAVGSLVLQRMLPVAAALRSRTIPGRDIAVIGWFGPRGVATIVFILAVLDGPPVANAEIVVASAATTVAASLIAHGATGTPLARWCSRWRDPS